MRLKQAITKYLEWGSVKYSIYTIRNYKRYLKQFCQFQKNKEINKITLDNVLNFQKSLKNRGLQNSTIFYYTVAIKELLKFFYLQGKIKLVPDLIPFPKYLNKSWHPAEAGDLRKMLKVLKRNDKFLELRDELILKFLFASGVRVSELCDLTLDEIDISNKEAIIITKKNLKKRVIMWDDITNEVLQTYLDRRNEFAKCDFIFINRRGRKLTTRQVQRIVKGLRLKAGIQERIVPHSFRHGLGMYGIEKNMNLRYLQVLLGHKNITSSQIYMPFKEKNIRKEYQKIFGKRGVGN